MGYKVPGMCDIREKEDTYTAVKKEYDKTLLGKKGVELLGACIQNINDEVYYPSAGAQRYYGDKKVLNVGEFFLPMITPQDIKADKMYLDIDDVVKRGTYHREILVGLEVTKTIKNKEFGTELSKLKKVSEETGYKVKDERYKINGFLFPKNKTDLREMVKD